MELIDYWYVLIRYRWKVINIMIVALVVTTIYMFSVTPIYQANSKILIAKNQTGNLLQSLSGNFELGNSDMLMQEMGKSDPTSTQIEIIKTRPILQMVIKHIKLTHNGKLYKPEFLAKKIKISPIKSTNIIMLSYNDTIPERSANVLNYLNYVIMKKNQELNQKELTATRLFILNQLAEHKKRLEKTEERILAYKHRNNTVILQEETTAKIQGAASIEIEKNSIDKQLQGIYAERKNVNGLISKNDASTSPFYSDWMKNVQENESKIKSFEAQKNQLVNQLETINQNLNTLPSKEIQLARLTRQQMVANAIYTNLLMEYEKTKIQEAAKISSIQVIEPAIVPELPIYPNKKLLILQAFLISLVFGYGLALFLDYLDDSIKSEEEIKKLLPYTILGKIPTNKTKKPIYVKDAPHTFISESLHLTHSNLQFKPIFNKPSCTIMITSAVASEGKSTITFNLAHSIAEAKRKIAIVNLDFRRPSWNHFIDLKITTGLTDYIAGKVNLNDIIIQDPNNNIIYVPSGSIPPNPTELLTSPKVKEMIEYLKTKCDIILFDTPPILLVSECLNVTKHMDGIILVVDINNIPKKAVKNLAEMLYDKNLPIIGTILNKTTTSLFGNKTYTAYYTK